MNERERLFNELVEKSGKSKEELNKLIKEKIDELSGLITEDGALHIVANELGIKLETEKKNRKVLNLLNIGEITSPKETVSFYAKILRKYDIVNFTSGNTEGKVQSILVGDETGVIRVTFWNDKTELLDGVNEGDIIKVVNGYTRENQGRIEVSMGTYSDIEANPEGVEINVKPIDSAQKVEKKINELEKEDRNVVIKGLVTDFDIPRFYLGCPECFKKVIPEGDKYSCSQHGEVEPVKVPICSLSLDDGTANVNLVVFRDNAERLTGLSKEDLIKILENIEFYRRFVKEALGKKVEVVGNVRENNFTGELEIMVTSVLSSEISIDLNKVFEDKRDESKKIESKESEAKDNEEDEISDIDLEEIDVDDI